jgi:hypothetical protein
VLAKYSSRIKQYCLTGRIRLQPFRLLRAAGWYRPTQVMIIITLGLWELLALTTMLWVISILQVTLFTRVKYDLLINLSSPPRLLPRSYQPQRYLGCHVVFIQITHAVIVWVIRPICRVAGVINSKALHPVLMHLPL